MAAQRFQISTRRTGLLRIVKVTVFDTTAEMQAECCRAWKAIGATVGDQSLTVGTCLPRRTWEDRDPRPYQARILLSREDMTAVTIAHEATHAAMHLYSIDCYRNHARAAPHLAGSNEIIPYLVGDIFSAIAQRIGSDGLAVGYGSEYHD